MQNKTIVINGVYIVADTIISLRFEGSSSVRINMPAGRFIDTPVTIHEKDTLMKLLVRDDMKFIALTPNYINVNKMAGFYLKISAQSETLLNVEYIDGTCIQYPYPEKTLVPFVKKLEEKLNAGMVAKPEAASSAQI